MKTQKVASIFFLVVSLFICFSIASVQAKEKQVTTTSTSQSLPTVSELQNWSYQFYGEVENIPNPGEVDLGIRKRVIFLFTPPEGHFLKQMMVGISRGFKGIIYAYAMGCWYVGEERPRSCEYDRPEVCQDFGQKMLSQY